MLYESNNYDRQTDRQTDIDNCNFIKTILMLLVVLYHASVFWGGTWFTRNPVTNSDKLGIFAQWLDSLHIYGFALVSGYLFFFLKFEKGRYNNKTHFIETKAKRLLLPFAFAALVWVIPWQIFYFDSSVVEIIKKYMFAINPSQLWFLWMLFGIFVIATFLSEKVSKSWFALGIVSIILYCIGFAGGMVLPNIFQMWTACQYFVFFAIGMILRKYGDCFVWRLPCYLWVVFDLILFVLNQFITEQTGLIFKIAGIGVGLLLHIVGAIMAFIVLNAIANKVKWNESKTVCFLQKHNFVIYLFHQQVIYGTISLLNGMVPPIVLVCINFAVAMMISSFKLYPLSRTF